MKTFLSQRVISRTARLAVWLLLHVCGFAVPAATVQSLFSATNSLSGVVLAGDGNFYGTTRFGGDSDAGSIFRLSPTGNYQQLYSFSGGVNGGNPRAALALGPNNDLYGTCQNGGAHESGTLFKISTAGNFSLLHTFAPDTEGGGPIGGLATGSDHLLYGTTSYGGTNGFGTLFRISTNGSFTLLHSFGGSDGASPAATLVARSDNALYGTTQYGGDYDRGTVFKITTSGSFSSLLSFNGANGDIPQAPLVLGSDSALYGMTTYGGVSGLGTVFRISAGGAFAVLHTFDQEETGANPSGGLLMAGGDFQGTARYGGAVRSGCIFQITSLGEFTALYDFSGGAEGAHPATTLALGSGGVYGTTEFGGPNGGGAFYKMLAAIQPYFDTFQYLNNQQVRYAGGGGTPNGQYTILSATSLATALANWTTNSTGRFDASGRFVITNTAAPDVRRFYRLRDP